MIVLCYRITSLGFCNKRFCNKKGSLFLPDPVFAKHVTDKGLLLGKTTKKPLQKQHCLKINYWIHSSQKLSGCTAGTGKGAEKVLNISHQGMQNKTTRKYHWEHEQLLEVYIGIAALGNSLPVSYRGKYMPTLWLIGSTSGDKSKRNEYVCPQFCTRIFIAALFTVPLKWKVLLATTKLMDN